MIPFQRSIVCTTTSSSFELRSEQKVGVYSCCSVHKAYQEGMGGVIESSNMIALNVDNGELATRND
jgi:hypothetical protein